MAGFDAGDEVEPLEFNFDSLARKYPGKYPLLEGVKGVSPEPSDEMIQAFQKSMRHALKLQLPDDVDPDDAEAVAKATNILSDEQFRAGQEAASAAVAELLSHTPTQQQVSALPFRHKRKYIAWVQRQLMNPEAATAATSP